VKRSITADDITGPALRGVPQKVIAMAWKHARILGVPVIPGIAIRNAPTSKWVGRYVFKWPNLDRPETLDPRRSLMEIQKRIMFDERSLERVVAHEMVHHAELIGLINGEARLNRFYHREIMEHGPRWQALADKVNRVMGADFVTVISDASYVRAPVTRPFVLMITKFQSKGVERIGYATAVKISENQREYLLRTGPKINARLIMSTDPRWVTGKKIGGLKVSAPSKPEDQRALMALYEKAGPITSHSR
jgi:hypothetical protein